MSRNSNGKLWSKKLNNGKSPKKGLTKIGITSPEGSGAIATGVGSGLGVKVADGAGLGDMGKPFVGVGETAGTFSEEQENKKSRAVAAITPKRAFVINLNYMGNHSFCLRIVRLALITSHA